VVARRDRRRPADSAGTGQAGHRRRLGLDITHPEFAARPNTILMNRQTTTEDEEDHGTEVSSVIGAPNNGFGIVGVYPTRFCACGTRARSGSSTKAQRSRASPRPRAKARA
jgi:hypothetical protein